MNASDYAAWYGAIVSSAVAVGGLLSHRRKHRPLLRASAVFKTRLSTDGGIDLRLTLRNEGGHPTTVSSIRPLVMKRRVPIWALRWKLMRKVAQLQPQGGSNIRIPVAHDVTLAQDGGETRHVFSSWTEDQPALRERRFVLLVSHSANHGKVQWLLIRSGLY